MASTDDLLQKGIHAAKDNRIVEARSILKQVIALDPRNEMAWLWLSGTVETDKQRIACLENVLTINPNNQIAQKGLSVLKRQSATIKPLPGDTESPTPAKAVQVPAPGTAVKLTAKSRQSTAKPNRKLSASTIGCLITIIGLIIMVIAMICALNPANNKQSTGQPTRRATPQLSTLVGKIQNANGYDWRAATESDKVELCKWMDANNRAVMGDSTSVDWRFLFSGLNEFYQSDDPFILEQKIAEVAAVLIISSNNE